MNNDYLDWVRCHPCVVCGCGPPSEPHHISFVDGTRMGGKPDDWYAVSMCRTCHNRMHNDALAPSTKHWLLVNNLRLLGGWLNDRNK